MPEARERPIIFSAAAIPGLLDGSKTQTRRIVKPQPHAGLRTSPFVPSGLEDCHGRQVKWKYSAGDHLWVREHWRANRRCDDLAPREIQILGDIWYETDNSCVRELGAKPGRFRHAIFMPRWASRITLEVTAVSAQRLQAITEADAQAEGAPAEFRMDAADFVHGQALLQSTHRDGFHNLWNQIHDVGSFEANPWVWAITFRRVTP